MIVVQITTDCMDHRQWASVARAAATTKQSNEVPQVQIFAEAKATRFQVDDVDRDSP